MNPQSDFTPDEAEVRLQLEKMLAHPFFRSKPSLSRLLAYIVGKALKDEDVTEQDLLENVFPRSKQPKPILARTNMTRLREALAEYYEGKSTHDRVVIAVPNPDDEGTRPTRGKWYRPYFRFSAHSDIGRNLAIARYLISGSPTQLDRGLEYINDNLTIDPNQPDTVMQAVQALGLQIFTGAFVVDDTTRKRIVTTLFEHIDRIEPRTEEHWRIAMLRGFLHGLSGDTDAAAKEFGKALDLDHEGTVRDSYYMHFMIATGKREEALREFRVYADGNPDDRNMLAAHGVFLFKANQLAEAEQAFQQALALDRNYWLAHYGLAFLHVSAGRWDQATEHIKRLEVLTEPKEFEDFMRRLQLQAAMSAQAVSIAPAGGSS